MKTLIHPTAVIHANAKLHPTVQVGAYAVIGENVRVGADTVIGSHVVLEGLCEIGTGNQIFPGAVIGMQPQDLKYVGEPTWVKIGNNNSIREYVTINRATGHGEATIIGNGNLLMAYVHVGHNCEISDSVIIANSVALAGHVHIESRARLSGVLGVHQFVHIGRMSMIGGMARIDRDVPPYMLVEGNPARVRSMNVVGLKRSGMAVSDFKLIKKAFRLLYHSDLLFKDALQELENLEDTEELKHLRRFLLLSQMPGRRGLIPGKVKKTVIDE
ncbi:acyl-ACP--UDP-N-acetylglucosamine O-acyltransferase [Dolichospermum circinale CS-1225]|uniref:acyl-ACP--UDP-N-acetylglucosamine O-acyltransferase n=1 Tax=Dolichospermum circinale TaxID=109265 RepID=UPI00041A4FA0|nr:acyl-ACP--UDP-N-acetylglucosamine O-acyltransferase [Dolichospermum circinale]MDB9520954.1 acyl-ACP--UDP-N-acetylglucosamine O-acyltransferase [Dolichospermum circinale CS-1225]